MSGSLMNGTFQTLWMATAARSVDKNLTKVLFNPEVLDKGLMRGRSVGLVSRTVGWSDRLKKRCRTLSRKPFPSEPLQSWALESPPCKSQTSRRATYGPGPFRRKHVTRNESLEPPRTTKTTPRTHLQDYQNHICF